MREKVDIDISVSGLQKGVVRNDQQLIAWDSVQPCNVNICPISSTCVYADPEQTHTRKCTVQVEYLQSFVDMIFNKYRYMGEDDMFKIGMHVIPLYSQLCRLKIAERGVLTALQEDRNSGRTSIHPIFREIRETIRAISAQWKELGFIIPPQGALSNPTSTLDRAGFGDPHHYAAISLNSDNKRNVIR